MPSYLLRLGAALLGLIVFVTLAITLQEKLAIPFAWTFRVACAGACLVFIGKVGSEYPGERWPRIAILIALMFNVGFFFSPLAHLPASKGDILLFGLPDAAILLTARIISYRLTDVHRRAVRQQMIFGLVLALAFYAIILTMMFIPAAPHSKGRRHPGATGRPMTVAVHH